MPPDVIECYGLDTLDLLLERRRVADISLRIGVEVLSELLGRLGGRLTELRLDGREHQLLQLIEFSLRK